MSGVASAEPPAGVGSTEPAGSEGIGLAGAGAARERERA
jgi:hypothetical protein